MHHLTHYHLSLQIELPYDLVKKSVLLSNSANLIIHTCGTCDDHMLQWMQYMCTCSVWRLWWEILWLAYQSMWWSHASMNAIHVHMQCVETVVRNTMVSLSEHVMITWCTLNWQCTQCLYIHMYCAEKHVMVSTTASCKHVHHKLFNRSADLRLDLQHRYRRWYLHTSLTRPKVQHMYVCTFGYPSMSHRPDTIYKKEEQEVGTYTLQNYITLQILMPRSLPDFMS